MKMKYHPIGNFAFVPTFGNWSDVTKPSANQGDVRISSHKTKLKSLWIGALGALGALERVRELLFKREASPSLQASTCGRNGHHARGLRVVRH